MTKQRKIILYTLIGLCVLGAVVYQQVQSAKAAGQINYRTAVVADGDVTDAVEASGVVQPLTTVDVKSRAGG